MKTLLLCLNNSELFLLIALPCFYQPSKCGRYLYLTMYYRIVSAWSAKTSWPNIHREWYSIEGNIIEYSGFIFQYCNFRCIYLSGSIAIAKLLLSLKTYSFMLQLYTKEIKYQHWNLELSQSLSLPHQYL